MAARPPLQSPIANKLALAMVAVSTAPLVLLDGELKIIAASKSFFRAFGLTPADVQGCELSELGDGEWAMPKLRSFLQATLSADVELEAYRLDL